MSPKLLCTLCILTCASAIAQTSLPPMDGHERMRWLLRENLSPAALLEDIAVAAEQTAVNSPEEYGPHWVGFGKRTGTIAGNYGVNSTIEAGFGSLWGEDPRYDVATGKPFGARLGHVIIMTFAARNKSGGLMPAYARFIAIPGSQYLSNQWRPDSEATNHDAAIRTGLSFLSRMASNAYKEFIRRR